MAIHHNIWRHSPSALKCGIICHFASDCRKKEIQFDHHPSGARVLLKERDTTSTRSCDVISTCQAWVLQKSCSFPEFCPTIPQLPFFFRTLFWRRQTRSTWILSGASLCQSNSTILWHPSLMQWNVWLQAELPVLLGVDSLSLKGQYFSVMNLDRNDD